MNRRFLTAVLGLAFCALLAGCAGTQGSALPGENAAIPSASSNIVDVGNPTEEPEMPKAMYLNERYGVTVEYPAAWALQEPNPAQADFSTDDGVDFTISFVDLKEGETFESFLTDLRGGFADLHEFATSEFDRAMSKYDLTVHDGKKFFDVERYYLQDQAPHRFVMIQSGLIDADVITSKMDQNKQNLMHGAIEIEKSKVKGPQIHVVPKP